MFLCCMLLIQLKTKQGSWKKKNKILSCSSHILCYNLYLNVNRLKLIYFYETISQMTVADKTALELFIGIYIEFCIQRDLMFFCANTLSCKFLANGFRMNVKWLWHCNIPTHQMDPSRMKFNFMELNHWYSLCFHFVILDCKKLHIALVISKFSFKIKYKTLYICVESEMQNVLSKNIYCGILNL